VLSEGVQCFKFFVANLTVEVVFVTVCFEVSSYFKVSFEQLAIFRTFKVFNFAVSDQVTLKFLFSFE
jgi:hypothetical protein